MPEHFSTALQSVVAITVTPFGADGGIDPKAYATVVDRLVGGGVTTVTANGNTSEFYALTDAELADGLAITLETVGNRGTVITGVGHDVERAIGLARQAARGGAAGIMVHQPVHPYQSQAGWVEYHRLIADAVPELGVVCYVRSPQVNGEALARLADACPNVAGVKYAVPDVVALAEMVGRIGDRLAWVCGLAEVWAPFYWTAGARGFTSGLANIAPERSVELLAALRSGDQTEAMRLWSVLKPIEDMRARNANADNVSVVKEALAQLGLCGPAVRPPSTPLAEADRAAVAQIVADLIPS